MAGKWPTGIRPSGAGIRVTLWRNGVVAYDKTIPGDPHNKTDLAAAVKHREGLRARIRLGLPLFEGDEGKATFETVAQRYINSLQIDADTVRNYLNILNQHWLPAYSGWPLEDITRADIKERLAATRLSIKTQKNILGPLRGVLKHGGQYPNPADGMDWAARQKEEVVRYLPAERDKLLAKLEGQDQAYFALLFATGLRPGEALGLEWSDYDGTQLSITKQHTRNKLKRKTKTSRRRMVYVPTWVRPILNALPTRFKGGALFVNTRGEPLKDTKALNKAWRKAHTRARVPYRIPYTCRHTRAAELLSQGVTPAEGAYQLGHSVQMFLEIYSEFISAYTGEQDFSRFESFTRAKISETSDRPASESAENRK